LFVPAVAMISRFRGTCAKEHQWEGRRNPGTAVPAPSSVLDVDDSILVFGAVVCAVLLVVAVAAAAVRVAVIVGVLGLPAALSSLAVRDDAAHDIPYLQLLSQIEALLTRPRP